MNKSASTADLDQQIMRIQRSTRTLFPVLIPLHNWLRQHSQLYYRWHLSRLARPAHWSSLGLLVIVISVAGIGLVLYLVLGYLITHTDILYFILRSFAQLVWRISPSWDGQSSDYLTTDL